MTIAKLQHAVRDERFETFEEYTQLIDQQNRDLCTLRGLMELRTESQAAADRRGRAGE